MTDQPTSSEPSITLLSLNSHQRIEALREARNLLTTSGGIFAGGETALGQQKHFASDLTLIADYILEK